MDKAILIIIIDLLQYGYGIMTFLLIIFLDSLKIISGELFHYYLQLFILEIVWVYLRNIQVNNNPLLVQIHGKIHSVEKWRKIIINLLY